MVRVMKAGAVCEMRAAHTELDRFPVHLLHKRLDTAKIGDSQCVVRVGAARNQYPVKQIPEGRLIAGIKTRHRRIGFDQTGPHRFRDQNRLIRIGSGFDHQNGSHDFGHGSGVDALIGIDGPEDLPVSGIFQVHISACHGRKLIILIGIFFRCGRKNASGKQGECQNHTSE